MSKTVPEGWDIRPLDGKIEILSGYPFKSSLFCDDTSKMGVIRIRDLVKQSVETFYAGDFDDEYVVHRGDILIGMDGDFNIVKWKTKNALLNQRICKVKASKDGGFNSDFLFYSLVDDLDSIHAATGATTVKHLSVKDIKGIEKAYPPLPEQQKIATILSSVDDVIEKTRAQIDKLKDLKTGMMQELLTKGIGSGGVPHTEFKDSPVGRIPASWNVVELGEIAKQVKPGPFGSSLTKAMYVERGYKVYGQEQVISGDFKLGDYYIDEAKYDELAAFKVASGDILISLVGTFGQVAVVPEAFEAGIINPRLLKIRFPSTKMDAEFSAQQLRSDFVLNQLKQLQQGGTMGVLSATTVKPVKLIVPPLKEQKVIGNAVHSIDSAISTKLDKLRSVQKLKRSLMQDLLTGKVRVNVTEKEKEPVVA